MIDRLTPGRVRRQGDLDLRPRVLRVDFDRTVQLLDALLDRLEGAASPLGLGVIGDDRLDASVRGGGDAYLHPRRRPATDRLVEEFADDRVEGYLTGFAEDLRLVDGEVDLERVRLADLRRERLEGGAEALVAQHDGLEGEREVAQLADRAALPVERGGENLRCIVELAGLDRVERGVEHQRDSRQVLHRAVVQKEGDAPPFVLLGRDQTVERLRVAQSMIASRSAIATACVRVSASSFVRMCRTWLLTVSCEMKSRPATSAFDIPSASSWRISRSRVVSMSVWSFPERKAGISAGST